MCWLLRFGYDGSTFAGWARQPGARTVEGVLLDGIRRTGVAGRPAPTRLDVASRTDRGVSARANALVLESRLPGGALLRALNGLAPEIIFSAAHAVPEEFRVRRPLWREYRYYLPPSPSRADRWRPLLPLFLGAPIDARSFARGVPAGVPCWRTIEALDLEHGDGGPYLRIRASGFLWGMVRKIVSALELVEAGILAERDLLGALHGGTRLSLPLAPPEPLVLWEVAYGLTWDVELPRLPRHQALWWAKEITRADARRRFLPELRGPGARGSAAGDPG